MFSDAARDTMLTTLPHIKYVSCVSSFARASPHPTNLILGETFLFSGACHDAHKAAAAIESSKSSIPAPLHSSCFATPLPGRI